VAVSLYVVGALAVTMIALLVARETAREDLEARSTGRFVRETERERTSTAAG
jgi:hypothetical protein